MLELYGKGYVSDFCISLFLKEQEQKAYQMYITDCLRILVNSMGCKLNARYIDIIEPKPEETRTADEIIEQVTNSILKCGKKGG